MKKRVSRMVKRIERVKEGKNGMKLFIGIDIGKRTHKACFLRKDGKVMGYISFNNRRNGFNRLLKEIEQFAKQGCRVTVIVEATGHYFLNLYSFLREKSIDVIVVNPIQTDSIRNLFIRKSKNDKRDSFIIANLARIGEARGSIINEESSGISNIRMLTRFRANYTFKQTNMKKTVSSLIDRVFPEFFDLFNGINSKTAMMILRNYPTPRILIKEDRETLSLLVNKWSRGRIKKEKVIKLIELAKQSIGSPIDIDAIEVEIPLIIDELFFIREQIKKIDKEIEEKANGIKGVDLLKTIPGISTLSAASIVGEIANIGKFSSVKKLRAFAGTDPSVRESGTSVMGKSKLSKRGSPYLRRTLYYAANASRRFSPTFKEYYKRKLSQHPDKKRYAIVATANKLLDIVYYVLKHNTPFDPSYQWNGDKSKGINNNAIKRVNKQMMESAVLRFAERGNKENVFH